jgi:hypothetical protein
MITVTVYKTQGVQTVRASIGAPTIEEAVRIAGEGARLELPIDGELFFAPQQGHPVAKDGLDDPRRDGGRLWGGPPDLWGDRSVGHGVRSYRQGPPAQDGG